MNKCQAITGGIFYCRDSAEINGSGSLQASLQVDSDVLRIRQQKHTAVRFGQVKKKDLFLIKQLNKKRI
jgi:hypothetical protein